MSSDSASAAVGPETPSTPRSGAHFSARSMPTTGSISLKKAEAPVEVPKPACVNFPPPWQLALFCAIYRCPCEFVMRMPFIVRRSLR